MEKISVQRISPFLWFDGGAEDAAKLYVSLFDNSSITTVTRQPDGTAFDRWPISAAEAEQE